MHVLGFRRKRNPHSSPEGSRQPATRHQVGSQFRTRPIDPNGDGDAVVYNFLHDALANRIHIATPDVQLEVFGSNA